jgi:hypothetical protein
VVSTNLLGWNEKNLEIHNLYPVSDPRFESGTSLIPSTSVTYSVVRFTSRVFVIVKSHVSYKQIIKNYIGQSPSSEINSGSSRQEFLASNGPDDLFSRSQEPATLP